MSNDVKEMESPEAPQVPHWVELVLTNDHGGVQLNLICDNPELCGSSQFAGERCALTDWWDRAGSERTSDSRRPYIIGMAL
jgi:hypothetical protein